MMIQRSTFFASLSARCGRALRASLLLPLLLGAAPGFTQTLLSKPAEFFVAVPGNLFARLGKNGPEGVFLETVDQLLKAMGKTPKYVIMPIGDALGDVATGALSAATVVVPGGRMSENMWLSDPVLSESNIVVALKDHGFKLNRLSDLNGKRIGARVGYRYPLLENKSGVNLQRFSTDGEMLRSLLFGQSDVILFSAISDVSAMRSEGIMKRLVILDKSVGGVPLVVAFAKAHFSKDELDVFNRALDEFKKSPKWMEILERNGLADLFETWPLISG